MVPGPGVDQQQPGPGGGRVERDLGALQRTAVEQQRVAGLAQQRRGLVHDAGRHPDELVLRPPGDRGELAARHWHPVQLGEGQRGRALERGRGGQARARGHVGVDGDAGAGDLIAGRPQRPGHPGRVRAPAGHRAGRQPVERDLEHAVRLLPGAEQQPPVGPPGGRDRGGLAQRERQHEPVVVVGVLAHQVGPARRQPHPVRRPAEPGLEQLDGAFRSQRLTGSLIWGCGPG
jgi:hypothetical protein